MEAIKIGIVGIGNCASSLVQGIEYYKDKRPEKAIGLMTPFAASSWRCGAAHGLEP